MANGKIKKGGINPKNDATSGEEARFNRMRAENANRQTLSTTEKVARERNRERKAEERNLPIPAIDGSLNLRPATSQLERSLLKTGAERRAGRIGFYDAMRGIRRSGTGAETQMRGQSAEASGNRRSPAFASGTEGVRRTTATQLAGQLRKRATEEAALVERDRAAREEFEKSVVAAYWARAESMDAQARRFLADKIFNEMGINVDEVAVPAIRGENK